MCVAETFGNFVRWRRAELELNRRAIARKLGVDPKTITNLERRINAEGVDDVTLFKLASVLKTPLEVLINKGADVVVVPLAGDVYESIVERMTQSGYSAVEEFLAAVATIKTVTLTRHLLKASAGKSGRPQGNPVPQSK